MRYWIIIIILFCGVLVNAQKADQERLEEMVTVLASDEMLGRGFGSPGGDQAEAYIIEQFKISGIEPFVNDDYRHVFNHRSGFLNIEGVNVAGIIHGSDPEKADEYVIIGAHYDHLGWKHNNEGTDTIVYNGADDNASGVAAITEIGRILSERKEKLGRSVVFVAFDGEESGLIGSKAFVKEFITPEESMISAGEIVTMFSLDMVGMYEKQGGLELSGIETLINSEELLLASSERSPIHVVEKNDKIVNNTDTAPFTKVGIPSIHVFTGKETSYHKPEDDSDLLDYEGMAEVSDFIAALVEEISNSKNIGKVKELESIEEEGVALKILNPGIFTNVGGSHFDFKDDYYKAKSVFSTSAGLMLETRITQWLAIQPEVVYQWSGSQYTGGNLRTHSVTVPLNLMLTTPDAAGVGVRGYVQAGFYYRYIFSGAQNGVPLDFERIYNDEDYGIVFGVGMEIMNLRLGFVYQSSLNDFTINNPALSIIQRDVRLRGSYARIGWVF